MKADTHPEYNEVVFQDISTGTTFITKSTAKAKDTVELDGRTLPLIRIEVSSASHPFYTGNQNLVDTEGRVEKFRQKYGIK